MKVFESSLAASKFLKKGCVLTLGNFDGVHLGHRAILAEVIKRAKALKVPSVLYTFDPHPVKFLAPQVGLPLLNTRDQKIKLLESCKLDAVIIEHFDRSLADLSPEDFFNIHLKAHLHPKAIHVGYDFTFGAKRAGNTQLLEKWCNESGIEFKLTTPQLLGNLLVSSTLIRNTVKEGNVEEAGKLLGRPFFIEGLVVKGDGRGKRLGFPTANILSENELLPKPGVYATQVRVGRKVLSSVANLGVKPTFGEHTPPTLEVHIFNLKQNLYGKKIEVHFIKHLRDEKKFSGPEELVTQIKRDIASAIRVLKS